MGRAHEKSSQSMLLFLMQKNQITCIKNEVMVILLIEKVIDNKMFPKSTAGLYISDSYQRNFISHRHRIFYGLAMPFSLFWEGFSFCLHRKKKPGSLFSGFRDNSNFSLCTFSWETGSYRFLIIQSSSWVFLSA